MIAALVLVALVLLAGVSAETGLAGAVGLAVVALLWFVVNKGMEGPTLMVVTEDRGLTGADLAGIAALLLAGWRGTEALRQRETGRARRG